MKKTIWLSTVVYSLLSFSAFAFDGVTVTKVKFIDEWDVGFTKVEIESPTSCGGTWFWMNRDNVNYNLYMSRVLAALMAGKEIRIAERAPGYCEGIHLYNPRIGSM
jgi:hypothetical protein